MTDIELKLGDVVVFFSIVDPKNISGSFYLLI